MLPPEQRELRIARMQRLIAAGQDTGYYPRSLLMTGHDQTDAEEYGTRYQGKTHAEHVRRNHLADVRSRERQ